ncbi:Scr1 family TA system antitoxin-like transcriptional regulator [Streptomyces sp. NPDC004726]
MSGSRTSRRRRLEEAGALVGISKATLSRYETKEGTVKWPVVDALCWAYGAADLERRTLVELAKGAKIQGWWRSLADPTPESMNLMRTLEDEVVRETDLPHITVQILPFASGAHAATVGSFVILGGPTPELDVVYVDIIGGGLFMEKPQELERYKLAFEYLRAQALDLPSSVALLDRASKEL